MTHGAHDRGEDFWQMVRILVKSFKIDTFGFLRDFYTYLFEDSLKTSE